MTECLADLMEDKEMVLMLEKGFRDGGRFGCWIWEGGGSGNSGGKWCF